MLGFNSGRKNFERCANKQVETTDSRKAVVRCAVTSGEGFEVSSFGSISPLAIVMAKNVGRAMCGGCPFVEMSREQVSAMRTQEAVTEGLQLEAEHRLRLLRQQIEQDTQG
jgi:hypothetical protein